MEAKYLIGLDLGTSNCAVAFTEPRGRSQPAIIDFPVPQLLRLGELAPRSLLPSAIYIPGLHEMPAEATRLPWGGSINVVVGEFARWQGARVPGRLVTSAKSWLCHLGVDRCAPILPWGAPAEVQRISPVEASALLLGHIRQAWDFAHPDAPLVSQEVVVTVPASFDEVARALTVNAAKQAGYEKFTLLEEPQAAFYDFTARHQHDLEQALRGVRLILVIDVGGGTSDFTLVQVEVSEEGPVLRRIAVGEHLMLGGDNMDATLSRHLEERMLSGRRKLSATQWAQLIQAARVAKEALLGEDAPAHYNLAIAGEGSRLLGSALSARLARKEAEDLILDGFFPACGPDDALLRGARGALQELGLPYAQDPAITRHLAEFLRRHARAGLAALGSGDGVLLPRPDAVLLNGGVFNSPRIAERLVNALSAWWPDSALIQPLRHDSLDLAVARGAAYFGLVRHGLGRRIGGGAARAFYVGLEQTGSESPRALCVIPRGQEEGVPIELGERVFQLALGRPVRFPLFSTTSDRVERAGTVVPTSEDLEPLPPIHALLKGTGGRSGNVPVHLRAVLTEIGTLELWCVSNTNNEHWRLEFELRGHASESPAATVEPMPANFAEAREWIDRIFGRKPPPASRDKSPNVPKDVKQLWTSLEKTLGRREGWRLAVSRELWSALFAGARRRRRSAEHERIFFQLAGYTLRPGFGYPLDDWRCEQMFKLFPESVQFHQEKIGWNEFWILWRRIAGGLNEAHHVELWNYLKSYLAQRVPPHVPKNVARPKGPEGLEEMVRLAAALEHLMPAEKIQLGDWIIARLRDPGASIGGPWAWSLGRLGARVPIYGSVHKSIDPAKAAEWVSFLLAPEWIEREGTLFAVSQLSRLTGDRARDLDDEIRHRVLAALRASQSSPSWQRMVAEVVAMEAADKARALGDTMPVGLQLE